jgi:magnesium transporter
MITYLRSTERQPSLKELTSLQSGTWIRSERPNEGEQQLLTALGIDSDILADALDPHEVPRIEQEDGWTYFITRLPDTDDDFNDYTTPILFALGKNHIVTISRDSQTRLWKPFIDNTKVPTAQKTKLFMLMIETISKEYQTRVASINRQMRATTSDVRKLGSRDIVTLTNYERKLNDYLDALLPTNTALEKLLGGKLLPLREDDLDLVEDLSIDLEQLIARCKSLLRTITNFRNSYSAVMDTQLNSAIRLLTAITLAVTGPTMVINLYSMNVPIPGQHSHFAFWVIVFVGVATSITMSYYFLRKK